MYCYYCGAPLGRGSLCPSCAMDVRVWKKVYCISNRLYNDGIARAQLRDLSGAVEYLKMSLRYNKMNMNARNLLGLVYFELGEQVNAISEWVISKSLFAEDNPASGYLDLVQKNAARLESIDQTVKKFNQALAYCRQGNRDLALIQLKKVLALNPKMVKGQQLLALLYMKEDRYDLAMRALKHAEKVDANNVNTQRYKKECRAHLRSNGKLKPKEKDTVTYQSGNDIIIRPTKLTDNTAVLTVVNLLVGAAIGIAVVAFLIIPGIRQHANTDANTQLIAANETISARERTIEEMQGQIDSLTQEVGDAQTATNSADEKTRTYETLLGAYVQYADEKYTDAGAILKDVDRDQLSADAQILYDSMMEEVQGAIMKAAADEGMQLYMSKDYSGAIEKFLEVVSVDEAYDEGEVAYYLGYAYMYKDDDANALRWLRVAAEHTNSANIRKNAQGLVKTMEGQGVVAPDGGQNETGQNGDAGQDGTGQDGANGGQTDGTGQDGANGGQTDGTGQDGDNADDGQAGEAD